MRNPKKSTTQQARMMSAMVSSRKIAVIPVYRNTTDLLKVLSGFPENIVDEICIVIDGATDGDLNHIKNLAKGLRTPIHIISKEKRNGVGAAIRNGIDYAITAGFSIVVVMAGNGKDQPSEIPRLLHPILNEQYDYVQGSRFLSGGRSVKTPFFRGVFSRLYPFIWALFTKVRCTDVTNGFRAYRLQLFCDKEIDIWQSWLDSYELEYYIHYKVLTLGYRAKEVPVSKIYSFRNKGGYSNISPIRDWWKIVGPLLCLKIGARK